ncbi:uncharacterized protein LOC120780508 [Bactrocera tryoni]|uniref:uncharacterized protein LOC120780508 n=1 Tax=Bactrocera tryoni TaxID=59916 RepID=UPI001A96141A|nr:uncharacterized protein LOC120780508 [Bactrocera tryoni]
MDEELFSQENEYEEFVAIRNQSPPPEAEIPLSSQRRRFQVSAPYNVQLRHSILQPDNLQQQDTVTQGIKEILRNQKVLMTKKMLLIKVFYWLKNTRCANVRWF